MPIHIPGSICGRCSIRTISLLLSVLLLLLFLVPCGPAYGQVDADEYVRRTLSMDIDTASYYELRDWLMRLELSTEGDREQLRMRLCNYYAELFPELKLNKKEGGSYAAGESSGDLEDAEKTLSIEEAGKLEFYSEEQTGRPEIRISGGVIILMVDDETGASHRIEANSLVFNRKEGRMSAMGEVSYVMREGDRTEEFTGEEISFDVKTYRGLFIGGMSRRTRSIEGEEISFYFRGEVIYRPEEDRVFLDRGMISSSTEIDPYYHIATDRLWVLGPDEWAFSDALLYIGRVPVFYFPFFFHPGDDVIFHPSFGFRNVEGYYFQTTTYLLGRRKEEGRNENSLSFLQIVDEDSALYRQERQGIFLRQTNEPIESSWLQDSDSYVKLLFDYYSRLGLFSALDAQINDAGYLRQGSFKIGAAFTDYIFPRPEYNAYSAFTLDPSTAAFRRFSQRPWVLGDDLPLRFGIDLRMEFDWERVSWDLELPIYSDPYLYSRFTDRDEEILWGSLLQGEEMEGFDDDPLEDPVLDSHFHFVVPLNGERDLLTDLTINRLDTRLSLNDVPIPDGYYAYPDTKEPAIPLDFYYPELFTPVDTAITLKGKILPWTKLRRGEEAGEPVEGRPADSFRPPWAGGEEPKEESGATDANDRRREPKSYADSKVYSRKRPDAYRHSLDYVLSPQLSFNYRYDENQRYDPAGVEFDPQFSYIDSKGYGFFRYTADLFGPYLKLENRLSFDAKYREHYPEEKAIDLSQYNQQDREMSRFSVDNKTVFSSYFLEEFSELDTSRLRYTFDSRYLTYHYQEAEENWNASYEGFKADSIRSHDMRLDLVRRVEEDKQSMYIEGSLPPLEPDNVGGLSIIEGPFEGDLIFRSRRSEQDDQWIHGPLDMKGKLNLWERSYLLQEAHLIIPEKDDYSHSQLTLAFWEGFLEASQSFDWNIDNDRPEKAKSSLGLWVFDASLEYRYLPDYQWAGVSTGWQELPRSAFQPYRVTAAIDAEYEPDPMWKNRVRLKGGLNTAYQMDLQRFTDNVLGIRLDLDAEIAEFLDFTFSLKSENRSIYSYIPAYAEELGIERTNVWEDFFKALNIFSYDDLLATKFNLKSLGFSMIHHLHDWELSFIYVGEPELDRQEKRYKWRSEFSIMVQWKPIPEIRKEMEYGKDEFVF